MIICKSDSEIQLMREAGKIVALAHEAVRQAVAPGITTKELDSIAEKIIRKHNAKPSFKGYNGFPASICASVNEELVHGIPGKRVLKDGDIISIDIGAYIHGFHGDSAVTLPVGNISSEAKKLLEVTEQSLYQGIKQATINNRLSDISHAIQNYAEDYGYSIVREYVGHGIGKAMHEDPQIPNFGAPARGPRLKKGMALAIEPMVNMGTCHVKTLLDNWTVITVDGKLCAHSEHTIVITDDGPEILTKL
jgi:methionyl aminopeptidase